MDKDSSINTANTGTLIRAPVLNHTSFFSAGKEVLRITATGITVNPDVSVDEAAAAVIDVLDAHMKHLAKRPWVGLTDAELIEIDNRIGWDIEDSWIYERAIEAKLREKNA
jgi:hypothetical protein